jgi:hypothetical protein
VSVRKVREFQKGYPGLHPMGEDLLNGLIEMVIVKYPDQSLTVQKIVLIIVIKTIKEILLKTRLPKVRLQGVRICQDLKFKNIENGLPILPNKLDARA